MSTTRRPKAAALSPRPRSGSRSQAPSASRGRSARSSSSMMTATNSRPVRSAPSGRERREVQDASVGRLPYRVPARSQRQVVQAQVARPVLGRRGAADLMATEALLAPHVLEYTYTRSTGPVIGAFLTGLRDQKFIGV